MKPIPDDLNDLFNQPKTSVPSPTLSKPPPSSHTPRIPYRERSFAKGLSRRHESVLKYMLEHPGAKQQDIAAATGYTPTWISRIVNCPEFQARFEEIMRPELMQIVHEFLTNTVEKP